MRGTPHRRLSGCWDFAFSPSHKGRGNAFSRFSSVDAKYRIPSPLWERDADTCEQACSEAGEGSFEHRTSAHAHPTTAPGFRNGFSTLYGIFTSYSPPEKLATV